MKQMQRKRIEDVLYERGIISQEQLNWAMKEKSQTNKRMTDILVDLGLIAMEDLLKACAYQMGIPYVNLKQLDVDYKIASLIPESLAKRYTMIAIGLEQDKLKVAMKDPQNMFALDDLKFRTKKKVMPVLAAEKDILDLIYQTYTSVQTRNIVNQVEKQMKEARKQAVSEAEEEDAPMVQLVNNILKRCILQEASDIHIEPFETYVRIRYRVDGRLQELERVQKETLNGMTTCIKVLSGLNIAEKRLPQDGRMTKNINGRQVDLRVSTLPTIYGEKTVIRFIYRTGIALGLKEIGFYPSDYEKVRNLLKNPHGIILLTGPTGSGKSTTLSAALKVLNEEQRNIITVEDPVENRIEGINQVTINSKIGLSFSSVLRSILRQDPDVIMVGEMRDSETSTIAIRAAITGHLVLSTLHTNDAASSIPRLIDMGTEAYMVGAAVKGVISQRLVRRLCSYCKMAHRVTSVESLLYKIPQGTQVYEANGCPVCNQTGYKGRLAVHEVLCMDASLEELISSGKVATEEIRGVAIQGGMRTLAENAFYNVVQGHTTMQEMLKIAYEQ